MKITSNIYLKNFKYKISNNKILKLFTKLKDEKNPILVSMSKDYRDSYRSKDLLNFRNIKQVNIIGMGGSILGAKAIYNFLEDKIKRKFTFIDNLIKKNTKKSKSKDLYLVISKSGNTLETIVNSNILIKKKHQSIFITENKNSYLMQLAEKIKSEVIHHNNFIGGRYSVLSEVGMLPAELMGFKQSNLRRLNYLIKNKKFINSLITSVTNTLKLTQKKKCNSIILNYDERSKDLFFWYQQLQAESLGKKGKGILPIISSMPKDNHSLMQFYLDGYQKNFFTFFFVNDDNSQKIIENEILRSHSYLKNKDINKILFSQLLATEKVFKKKNIPFRSFFIAKRSEQALGELFTFFILETILLGRAMELNPFNQPAVELIKEQKKKNLVKI